MIEAVKLLGAVIVFALGVGVVIWGLLGVAEWVIG